MTLRRKLLVGWLALLVCSNAWRLLNPPAPVITASHQTILLDELDDKAKTGRQIRLAYRQFGDRTSAESTIILLHGTPVASAALIGLGEALAAEYHVIAPDLPGFGGSLQALPDYSSITHGYYLAALMDALEIERAYVVAYSQGGAAAITLTQAYPKRVDALVLVATIGVQELELFGSYAFNHLVYAGQLGLVRAAQWLLPHFGYLDNAILGPGYARNLTDTDQRPLRAWLQQIEQPTLIVHGEDDGLVPLEAGLEHHRLLPQSELFTLSGGHEIAYATPERIAPGILQFLERHTDGQVATRATADSARIAAASDPMGAIPRRALTGGALLVLFLAIVVASYVSEDLACIAAGILAAQGVISFPLAVVASLVGLFTGDLALFAAGRWVGRPTLQRWVHADKLGQAQQWLADRGPIVIIASRFMPGTRLPTYLAAGALQMPWLRFTVFFALATLIWTPLLVGLASLYGDALDGWFTRYADHAVWVALALFIVLWLTIRTLPLLFSWEGRRQLYSRWLRLTRYEYWPRMAFYPPIALYCIWLAIRFRSATLFTLANPAMPLGGLVGESKSEILRALQPSGAVAPFCVLTGSPEESIEALQQFMSRSDFSYPIVLKPDTGQRGQGVVIAKDTVAAEDYLRQSSQPVIVQRFVTGEEYGVFYVRRPDEERGTVFSLTHKGTTSVIGDGKKTLKQLILGDSRAVAMARFFLELHGPALSRIPKAQESVALNEIGTHSRGSLFTDAAHLLTPALTARLDQISRHYSGFYFGRYDLIAPSAEALQSGTDLQILELNGVTSEATHIYDPGSNNVFAAWRTIAHQWRLAWEIGDILRRQGHQPASVSEVLRAVFSNEF
ncbi:MAG: alpha/beta fold hydrolase [Pseudomonadota bacterium]